VFDPPRSKRSDRKKADSGRRRTSAGRPPPRKKKGGRRSAGARRGWLLRLAVWGGSAAIWGGVALALLLGWYAYDLPDVGDLSPAARKPSVTLVAADGTLLASYGDLFGEAVTLADLPPYLPQAVMAVEDRRFYDHVGVDPWGLARAMLVNLRAGRIVQGGSTITQQLAKNLFLTPERTLKRKVQEMVLALWLEWKFGKDEILALYLNRVYLGAGTWGVDAAARHYFGKPAAGVTLYEAAQIAGLLKAPSRYNPVSDRDLSARRTQTVLAAMVDAGYIDEAEAARAARDKTAGRARAGDQARYFADWILAQVPGYVGPIQRDLTVITTLNSLQQRIAEEELALLLANDGAARDVSQGAVVILAPDGAVRAMVGGRDYDASQFNRATQALRQPGSAFKTFVYLAAVEAGRSPDDRMIDAPVTVGTWSPGNFNDKYYGEVTLREGFARSLNSVAVRLSEQIGRARVAAAARRLGITSDLDVSPSLALGASEVTLLEMTGAYAVFANGGYGVWPHGIEEIRDGEGRLLYRRAGGGPGRLVAPRDVDAMTDLLRATVAWGSGKAADPGRPAGGKTGTSQEFRDAWFVGFTTELTAGVWLGNDDGAPMQRVTGGALPAQLWGRIMSRALEGFSPKPLPGGDTIPLADAAAGETFGRPPAGEPDFIGRILRSLGAAVSEETGSGAASDGDSWQPMQRPDR